MGASRGGVRPGPAWTSTPNTDMEGHVWFHQVACNKVNTVKGDGRWVARASNLRRQCLVAPLHYTTRLLQLKQSPKQSSHVACDLTLRHSAQLKKSPKQLSHVACDHTLRHSAFHILHYTTLYPVVRDRRTLALALDLSRNHFSLF